MTEYKLCCDEMSNGKQQSSDIPFGALTLIAG